MMEDLKKNLAPYHKMSPNLNSSVNIKKSKNSVVCQKTANCGTGYILLSAVAKEKKYAQEYLGLLARRGDVGSIRIGKRWYTTTEWFSEFLADAEAKKAEVKNMKTEAKPIERKITKEKIEEVFLPQTAELQRRGSAAPIFSENLKNQTKAEKAPLRIGRELPVIDLRKKIQPQLQRIEKKNTLEQKDILKAERENQANRGDWGKRNNWEPRKEAEVWNDARGASPIFLPDRSRQFSFFPKFAFSMSVVLLLILLIQVGWVYKNELKRLAGLGSGIVAGAQESKIGLDVVRNSSVDYLGNQGDKLRENISLSRVFIRAAMERNNEQGSATNGQ